MGTPMELGREGESRAERFLRRQGYEILERNFRCPLGEIDLLARQDGVLCFIEVKTRRTEAQGDGLEAVTPRKQRKIVLTAQWFLMERGLGDVRARFDVVSVDQTGPEERVLLVKDAFGAGPG